MRGSLAAHIRAGVKTGSIFLPGPGACRREAGTIYRRERDSPIPALTKKCLFV